MSKVLKYKVLLIVLFVVSFIASLCVFSYFLKDARDAMVKKQHEYDVRQKQLDERLQKLETNLDLIEQNNKDMERKMTEKNNKNTYNGKLSKDEISGLVFTVDTDLKEAPTLTAEDMDNLIEVWNHRAGGDIGLYGKGAAFIQAANESGYNPVYLLAHAAVESGWGTSYLAVSRGNMYGIGAFDSDPDAALNMGDSIDQGIVSGSIWINDNFYEGRGTITLQQMKDANYASNPDWAYDITQIVNTSYRILENII